MVEVKKLWTLYDFCGPRATLCGAPCGRCPKTGLITISAACARPSAEIVRVEAPSLWRRANLSARAFFLLAKRPFGSCLVVCAPAFAIPRSRVRFLWSAAAPARKSQLLSTNVVRGVGKTSDSCGVRTHALTDWRLKPAP